jgi:signal transduction histidine kinase
LKHRHRGYWIGPRPLAFFAMWLALMSCAAWSAGPDKQNGFQLEAGQNGPAIRFKTVDIAFSDSYTPPDTQWTRVDAEPLWPLASLPARRGNVHTVWARVRFDRKALDREPLAIFTQDNREQIMIFFNGEELFRNFSSPDEHVQGWYRPYLAPIPLKHLRLGTNEIMMRVDSNTHLGVGQIVAGPQADLQQYYARQNLWRVEGVKAANYAMLALSLAAFLFWLGRRRENELLFLALSGPLWFLRDYHYFVPSHRFDPILFYDIALYALYFASASTLAFCALFLKVPRAKEIIIGAFSFGALLCVLNRLGLVDMTAIYLATFAKGLLFCGWVLFSVRRTRLAEHWLLLFIISVLTISGGHDIGRFRLVNLWEGLDFYVQPYIGLIFCIVLLLSFGRRAIGAFSALENVNQTLEQKVAEARSDLAESEGKRRELEVAQAIDSERHRLMREMHDGIGSNLVTALAIAEQQKQPPATIKTLKRAISDLKITVDSLEPVEGDLVALLANLRHRMTRDLKEAGVSCKWKAEPCPQLPWLDATNALHVLRIFQEAIGNALTHSQADSLEIGCHPATQDGREGLVAFVSDNGIGFPSAKVLGKGLANMRARAEALHGMFDCQSALGMGTRVMIWLPYVRDGG